jgi:hypothetical protein
MIAPKNLKQNNDFLIYFPLKTITLVYHGWSQSYDRELQRQRCKKLQTTKHGAILKTKT